MRNGIYTKIPKMNLFKNLGLVLICDSNSIGNLTSPLKRFVKASNVLFELFGEKKFKKKEKRG